MTNCPQLVPSLSWIQPSLTVAEAEKPIVFNIQEAFNFHGYDAVGGVVLAFRLLQRAIALLSCENELIERRMLTLFTAFPGSGAKDCFELVTRMVSDHRFMLDIDYEHEDVQHGIVGSFYFRFSYQGKTVALAPVEGQPSERFLTIGKASKQPDASPEIKRTWRTEKYQLANALLISSPKEVIRIIQ